MSNTYLLVRRSVKNWTYSPEDRNTPRDARGMILERRLSAEEARRKARALNLDPTVSEYNHWAIPQEDY